ncbi:hypothetical protein IQ238_19815 [Pleurocapsales cyanobacterium LEGE 06147]|nr:hypothetical protein [Pleurocapsales cyanobacterium LEGE 06147]
MKGINPKLATLSVIALSVSVSTLATPQKADAQVMELATSAINAVFNRPRKPIPNQTYIFGTNNLHSNSFCLFPCAPIPNLARPVAPTPTPPAGFSSQGISPGVGVPPQAMGQLTPPRPTLVVPPIKLPINLPF